MKTITNEIHALESGGIARALSAATAKAAAFLTLLLTAFLLLPGAAGAVPGQPDTAFGPGTCIGGYPGFSSTFYGGPSCTDTEVTQAHTFGRGVGLQYDMGTTYNVVVGGWEEYFSSGTYQGVFAVSRYDLVGNLDPTFGGGDGKVTTAFAAPARSFDLLVRSDESIVMVGGDGTVMLLAAYLPGGGLDWQVTTPVLASESARGVAMTGIGPRDEMVVVGTDLAAGYEEIKLARFDSTGTLVASFGTAGVVTLSNATLGTVNLNYRGFDVFWDDAEQSILLAGDVENPATGRQVFFIARLDSAGNLRTDFGGGSAMVPVPGVQTVGWGALSAAKARGIERAPNGDIYAAGTARLLGIRRFAVARLSGADGTLVGKTAGGPFNSEGHEMKIDSRNRVVVVGEAPGAAPQTPQYSLMRFNEDLSVDTNFGTTGPGFEVAPGSAGPSLGWDLVIRTKSDGAILVAGDTVPDASSISPYVTNWWQTAARFQGGPVCGNGILETGEQCESPFGACCTAWCSFVPSTTTCRAAAGVCDVEETCTGTSDSCPADSVEPAATKICRLAVDACDASDYCDGTNKTCPADDKAVSGTACGSSSDTDCDDPDTCDGSGACVENYESSGTTCGSNLNTDCDDPDTCDGSGSCLDNYEASGATCGDSTDSECTDPDTCDGAGSCEDNHEPPTTMCGDAGSECVNQDYCFAGNCIDNGYKPAGTAAPTLCDDGEACTADVCDGAGGCDNSGAVSSAGIDYNEDGSIDSLDDVDTDSDGVIDACDNCVSTCNPDQLDTDEDCSYASAPWTISDIAECGDTCDICPATDEAAMSATCSTWDYNSATDCCEGTGEGVSVDADGESCSSTTGDVIVTSSGSNGSAGLLIPEGAVDEDTSFSLDSKTKGGDEFFIRGASGTYVEGYDFGPEGVTFDPPVVVCMWWNDADNDGVLEKSEGYDYKIFESKIAPYHIDSSMGEYKLADKCGDVPCGSIDSTTGFPDDYASYTRYDESSTTDFDESTLSACCDATENLYCFEVRHFSTYGLVDPDCATENLESDKLKVTKVHREPGAQKVVFSADVMVPVDEETEEPDPAIDPIENGFQFTLLGTVSGVDGEDASSETLWGVHLEGGAYDKERKTGWKQSRNGSTYTFRAGDREDGLKKVVIKKKYNKSPGLVSVKLVASKTALSVDLDEHLPLQAEISLDPSGFLDRCAVTDFNEPAMRPFCAANGSETAVSCR